MTISSGVTENQIERENSERSGGDGCRNRVFLREKSIVSLGASP